MENLCEICKQRLSNDTVSADILSSFLTFYSSTIENDENSGFCSCSLCLGLLNAKFCKRLMKSLKEKLDNENYDASDFNICISYPIAMIIRERLFEIYKENISAKLKDFTKLCYKAVLEDLLCNFKSNQQSEFNICINLSHPMDEIEGAKMFDIFSDSLTVKNNNRTRKRKRTKYDTKKEISRGDLFAVLPQLNLELVEKFKIDTPPKAVKDFCNFEILLERQPLFIGGRYLKFSRHVNQTPWMVDGVMKSKASVQELIAEHFSGLIKCDEIKFSAAGREDADVRMLGDGRPFVLQFINPRRATFTRDDLNNLETRIHNTNLCQDVKVLHLCKVTSKEFEVLKQGEEDKKKHYSALCYSPQIINEEVLKKIEKISQLEIIQKTPVRVLHRRPLHDRKRSVDNLRTLPVDEHHFQLFLVTQAGTYVKEFVHGDFGRTFPSLSDLLEIPIDILELDVDKVELDWPPTSLTC